jgi:hypothetical protein
VPAATQAGGEPHYRDLLCLVAGLASLAIMGELALIGHWNGRTQLLAWLAAYANLGAAWAAAEPTSRRQIAVARTLAAVTLTVAGTGVAVHLHANFGFESELHPEVGLLSRWWRAAAGGLPLLAPLSLALPAVLIALATWRRPTLPASQLGWPGPGRWGTVGRATIDGVGTMPCETKATAERKGPSWTTSRYRWKTRA